MNAIPRHHRAVLNQSRRNSVEGTDDQTSAPQPSAGRRFLTATPFYIFLIDIALVVTFTSLSNNHIFWSWPNEQAVLGNCSEALLLATGATVMLAAGAFDLSLGANVIISSVVGGTLLEHMTNSKTYYASLGAIILALLVCLGVGTVVGVVNGFLITALRVNSLIATLGTMGICTGLGYLLVNGADLSGLPTNLQSDFGLSFVLEVPIPTFVAFGVLVFFWVVLRYSRYGIRTLSIGSNRASADRAGIHVNRHILSLMVIGGFLAGLAGFFDIARFATTDTSGHTLDSLAALTATVVGGTPLIGGRANMWGTFWGVILAYVILDGLIVQGLSTFYQFIATGVILIAAVAVDANRTKRRV